MNLRFIEKFKKLKFDASNITRIMHKIHDKTNAHVFLPYLSAKKPIGNPQILPIFYFKIKKKKLKLNSKIDKIIQPCTLFASRLLNSFCHKLTAIR